MNKLAQQHQSFETIRHQDEHGNEFWQARELAVILEYIEYRNFLSVLGKAMEACENSGHSVEDHFGEVTEMVTIGSGAKRQVQDMRLSRYACYLIVQNGDPSKQVIALGQTYFALQTRKQELQDEFSALSEDERRLAIRQEVVEHNKALAAAAQNAGVITPQEYAVFQDHGYRGLYGGLGARAIHMRKGLKKSQKILDHMGSTELAANLFRATQAEEKLKREQICEKSVANRAHKAVGEKVRQTIQELGGTMPEDLPTPEKSIQQIEKERKRLDESRKRDLKEN